ncbi:unnamed protein product [Linum trigynum]|uniref:Uncharacterized protein n=1 Tax=Linum trigynum TaxID=586398 RepID=A0AAV2F4T6_9ROSI
MESNRIMGKESRAQMWVQRRIGFNFMSFRKLQNAVLNSESTAVPDPCFTSPKQNGDLCTLVDDEGVIPEHDAASEVSVEVEGMANSEAAASAIPEVARIELLTKKVSGCPTLIEHNRALVGRPTWQESHFDTARDTFRKSP